MADPAPLLILAHEAAWERRFQVTSLAASEAAADRSVDIALFFGALRAWTSGAWDAAEPTSELDPERLAALDFPPLSGLLAEGRERGLVRVFACSASVRLLGLDNATVQPHVDAILGWQSFSRMVRDAHRVVSF